MNESEPNTTPENSQSEDWDMTPPETEAAPESEPVDEDNAPEGAVDAHGWIRTRMYDGSLAWVPPVPDGEDPVDFYLGEGYPVAGLPGLQDYHENQ